MNILVIGHSVVDKLIDKDITSIKPGGIFYTVVSFLSQIESKDKLYLCSSIDSETENLFKIAYDKVEKEYIERNESVPFVELKIDSFTERRETYSHVTNNLNIPSDKLDRFEGILINMITGYDILLTQLQQLRRNYNGLVYFDVHTLSRGVDKNLSRIFRRIEGFNKWAECIDILQANESELLTLSDKNDEFEIIDELFSFGIKQIIITRAEKGATVFFSENDVIKNYHKNALNVIAFNKVGCGDVFGAVYFHNYIKNKNVTLALEQANLFAGVSTKYFEAKDFLNLKKDANEQIGKK
jgi:hypothetical protein